MERVWLYVIVHCVLHTPSAIASTPLSRGDYKTKTCKSPLERGDLGVCHQITLNSYGCVM